MKVLPLKLKSWEKSWLFKFYTPSASSSNSKVKQLNKHPTTIQRPEAPHHPRHWDEFGINYLRDNWIQSYDLCNVLHLPTIHIESHPPHPPPHSDVRASWHYSALWDFCSTRSTWSWKFQELPLRCHCDTPTTWYHRRPAVAFVGCCGLYVHGDYWVADGLILSSVSKCVGCLFSRVCLFFFDCSRMVVSDDGGWEIDMFNHIEVIYLVHVLLRCASVRVVESTNLG